MCIRDRVTALRDEEHLLDVARKTDASTDSDVAAGLPGVDYGSYFDWRGFFKMLGIALAVIAGLALLAALVS